jgi:hypothetical protein
MRFALFLAASPLWAAGDANAIIQRLLEAQKANGDRIQPYTYIEEAVHSTYDKNGALKRDYTETSEIIFVEGYPFHKLVARNGKPLPAKEQAAIQRMVDQTAEQRRRQPRPPAGGQLVMGDQRIDLGANRELLTLFDNNLKGEEEIRGRKAWVVECTPGTGREPPSEHEREVLSFRRTLWIDQAENVPLRIVMSVIGEGIHFALPGSTLRIDYDLIAPGVWCESGVAFDIWHRSGKEFKPWKRTEYTESKFRKFDVQSTITVPDH